VHWNPAVKKKRPANHKMAGRIFNRQLKLAAHTDQSIVD
jgi:hypothetical protein